jgi:hypothetical protein
LCDEDYVSEYNNGDGKDDGKKTTVMKVTMETATTTI